MLVLLLLAASVGSGAVRKSVRLDVCMQGECTKERMEQADQQDTLCEFTHARTEHECVLAALSSLFPDVPMEIAIQHLGPGEAREVIQTAGGGLVLGPQRIGEGYTSTVDFYQIPIPGQTKMVAVKLGGYTHYLAGDSDPEDNDGKLVLWDTAARYATAEGRNNIRESVFGLAWKNEFEKQKHASQLGISPKVYGAGQCVKWNFCMLKSRGLADICERAARVCASSYVEVPAEVGVSCCVSTECGKSLSQEAIDNYFHISPGFQAIPDPFERTSHLGVLVMEARLDLTTGMSAPTLGDHLADNVQNCLDEGRSLKACVEEFKAPPNCALGLLQSAFCAIESAWKEAHVNLQDSHFDNFLVAEKECSPTGEMSRYAVQIIDYGAARSSKGVASHDFLDAHWEFLEEFLASSIDGFNFTEAKGRKALAEAGLVTLESTGAGEDARAVAKCPGRQMRVDAPEFVPISQPT